MKTAEPQKCHLCHRITSTIQIIDVRSKERRYYQWCDRCDGPAPIDLDQASSMHKLLEGEGNEA